MSLWRRFRQISEASFAPRNANILAQARDQKFLAIFVVAIILIITGNAFAVDVPNNVAFQEPTNLPQDKTANAATKESQTLEVHVSSWPAIRIENSTSTTDELKNWAPLGAGFLGLLGALAAVWVAARNTNRSIEGARQANAEALKVAMRNADQAAAAMLRANESAIWQKANENEIKQLQDKLDQFYGVLINLLDISHLLAQELRARQENVSKYRLLTALFDDRWKNQLSAGDKTLVREICAHVARTEEFIQKNAQMVDIGLAPYLSRVVAHFRILGLAYRGELGTDPTNFLRYVYPQQLDGILKLEIERLTSRVAALRASPAAPHPPITSFVIPKDLELPSWPDPRRAILSVDVQPLKDATGEG